MLTCRELVLEEAEAIMGPHLVRAKVWLPSPQIGAP